MQSDAPLDQMLATAGAIVGAGWQSGKFLYVDTDLKIDLPAGARGARPRAHRRSGTRPRQRRAASSERCWAVPT